MKTTMQTYTTVALALIAAAALTTTAKAARGDLVLGIYDTANASGPSYEVDLGAYNSISANESFDLGSTISDLYGADAPSSLVFNIATTAGLSANNGLAAKEVAFTSPASAISQFTYSGSTSTITANLDFYLDNSTTGTALATGTSSSGKTFTVTSQPGTENDSFQTTLAETGGSYGFGGGTSPSLILSQLANGDVELYTVLNGNKTTTDVGTFQFSGVGTDDVVLTWDPAAAPEPSSYALGLCAAALLVVLRRRKLTA